LGPLVGETLAGLVHEDRALLYERRAHRDVPWGREKRRDDAAREPTRRRPDLLPEPQRLAGCAGATEVRKLDDRGAMGGDERVVAGEAAAREHDAAPERLRRAAAVAADPDAGDGPRPVADQPLGRRPRPDGDA